MVRLLHLADVHLDASFSAFGDLADSRREEVLDAFRSLPDVAARHEAHAVLIAGDLFDSPRPRSSTLAATREAIRRTVESDRPVFIVPGNHDSPTAHPHPYRRDLGGARVFDAASFGDPASVSTPGGQLHVYGLAYDAARDREPLSGFRRSGDPGLHVVLLHAALQESPRWKGSPNSLDVRPEQLRQLDVDYIALGHYHRFRPPDDFAGDGSIPACYPGSFADVDLSRGGASGFALVELREGEPPRVAHRRSGVQQVSALGEIDVTELESDAQVADAIAERVDGDSIPVIRLIGSPRFALDARLIHEHLCARFGHARVIDESLYYSSTRLDEIAGQDTIAGHLVRLGRVRVGEARDEETRYLADQALRVALRELGVE
ncbi:MAG: metallophosphoesterase family protein [Acidobacteriota bacterium]